MCDGKKNLVFGRTKFLPPDFVLVNNFEGDGLPALVSLAALTNSARASPIDVNINNTTSKNTKQEEQYVNKQC